MSEKVDLSIESQEKLPPKRVFVEIGPGWSPAAGDFVTRKFTGGDVYIGVENDPRRLESLQKHLASDKSEQSVYAVAGDAFKLPFLDRSIDEIFYSNFLGNPRYWSEIERKDKEVPRLGLLLLDEAKRVLKLDGTLIIRETYTPPEIELLKKLLELNGFNVANVVFESSPGWEEAALPYDQFVGSAHERERRKKEYSKSGPLREEPYIVEANINKSQ